MSFLFKNIDVVTRPGECLTGVNVLVTGGKIEYIGKDMPATRCVINRLIAGEGKLMMPGLYNSHTHVPMNCTRGYADDMPLKQWLEDYMFPIDDRLDDEAVEVCAYMGMADMIRNGTVSFSDQYFGVDAIASAAAAVGLKANISRSCVGGPDFDAPTDRRLNENIAAFDKWHNYDNGRIRIDFSVHAEYSTVPKMWEAIAKAANDRNTGISFHISETQAEHEGCLKKYGETPTALFEKAGLLGPLSYGAHGVWCNAADLDRFAATGTSIVSCPCSNLKLGSGIANLAVMRAKGVNVALGTDGAASNNALDMFGEMKTAALVAKGAFRDPARIAAWEALEMATVSGARSQGRTGGTIEVGADADLLLLDADTPALTPCHNAQSNMVYAACGRDVVMNMVRGKVLYENGEFKTLDWEKIRRMFLTKIAPRVFGV